MLSTEVRNDINLLVRAFSDPACATSPHKVYRALVKKYHPDVRREYESSDSPCPMVLLNSMYSALRSGHRRKSWGIRIQESRARRTESPDDAAYETLKMANRKRDTAMSLIEQPYDAASNLRIVADASEHLYMAQLLLTQLLRRYPESIWAHDARSKLRWCERVSLRITQRLCADQSTDLVLRG